MTDLLGGLERRLQEQEAAIRQACASGNPINVANATMPLGEIRNSAVQLRQAIEQTAKTVGSLRIPASLDRFERFYIHFLIAQNVRWLILDVLLPLAVAGLAFYYLWRR